MPRTLHVHAVMHARANEYRDMSVFDEFYGDFTGSMGGLSSLPALADGSEALILTWTTSPGEVRAFQCGTMTVQDVAERKAAAVLLHGNDAHFRARDPDAMLLLWL